MRRLCLALSAVLALAACGTPQQRCIADATRDLSVVSHLIAQLQTDIARGYGMRETQIVTPVWRPCFHGPRPEGARHSRPIGPDMCFDDELQTVQTPVAIDLARAQQTLAGLKKKQAELMSRAGPAVEQCKALYPE